MEEKKEVNVINWFPGHMQKTRRQMQENLKLVDIVIELRDARLPLSSANPMIEEIIGQKPRLLVLTKRDMADPKVLNDWLRYFKAHGIEVLAIDATHDDLKKLIVPTVKELLRDKLERAKARGIRKKVLRAMICGIPNVGKSTFINGIVKKRAAKVENRPGVTRSLSWIRLNEDLELLDTPGVLWPRLEDQKAAKKLVLIGSIKDEVVDLDAVVSSALLYLKEHYPSILKERYHLEELNEDPKIILDDIAISLNLLADGKADTKRAQNFILKDIRSERLKGISLEEPNE